MSESNVPLQARTPQTLPQSEEKGLAGSQYAWASILEMKFVSLSINVLRMYGIYMSCEFLNLSFAISEEFVRNVSSIKVKS